MSSQDQRKEKSEPKKVPEFSSLGREGLKSLVQDCAFDLVAIGMEQRRLKDRRTKTRQRLDRVKQHLGQLGKKKAPDGRFCGYQAGDFVRYKLRGVIGSKVYPYEEPHDVHWVLFTKGRTAKKFFFVLRGSMAQVDSAVEQYKDDVWRQNRIFLCTNHMYILIQLLKTGMEYQHIRAWFYPSKKTIDKTYVSLKYIYMVRNVNDLPIEDYPERIVFDGGKRKSAWPCKTTVLPGGGSIQVGEGRPDDGAGGGVVLIGADGSERLPEESGQGTCSGSGGKEGVECP